jgi:hypothetical protein
VSELRPAASAGTAGRRPGTGPATKPGLSGLLFPVAAVRAAPLEVFVVFLLGSVAAFFRLGDVALRGNVWAEDGRFFLTAALLHNGIAAVFEPYAGYMNLTPRVLAAVVASLPLWSQGVALNLAASLVQAAVATLAYVGTCGFIRQRLWRLLLAIAVVAVPVGPEVIEAIANLQWFLIFGGCVCLLWTPRRPLGWAVLFGALLITAMSSPFAVILLAGALGRLLVQRSRVAAVLAAVVATGFAIQTMVMVNAPARGGRNALGVNLTPARLGAGFLRRVLGDGVLGVGRYHHRQPASGLVAGVTVATLLAVLVIWLIMNDGFPAVVRAGLFGLMAILTFSLPVVLTPALTTEGAFGGGRYYVPPALLTIAAIMCLIAAVFDTGRRPPARLRWPALSVGGVLVLSLVWGLGTSWTVGEVWGRQNGPSWQPGVDQARRACAASPAQVSAKVPTSPPGWSVSVPCERLRA